MRSSTPSKRLAPLLRRFCLVIAVGLATTAAQAQINTGEIGGIVRDSSGAVLPGATVTATHPASGTAVERVTDAEGRFFLPALAHRQLGSRSFAWRASRRRPGEVSSSKSAGRCSSTSRSASRA